MPALWQSSQRPMYVRTVWVDGFRHAILTHDDPYLLKARKRRPHSSASWMTNFKLPSKKCNSRLSHHDNFKDYNKFDLVIKCNKSNIINKQEEPIEKLDLAELDKDSDEDLATESPQPPYELDSCRDKFNTLCLNMRTTRTNRTDRSEIKTSTELSDRVLQWLDLAGKIDLLAPENVERMTQPRHSWPEIQKRNQNYVKPKTTIEVKIRDNVKINSPKPGEMTRAPQSGTIDRQDFYVPTSATTIENYARQSRNTKSVPRSETYAKTKEQSNKTKPKELRTSVQETRNKLMNEKNAVAKQYAHLLNKKLIPDVVNTKKQVHIFMPDLPKKTNSTTTSRTESLLSQRT